MSKIAKLPSASSNNVTVDILKIKSFTEQNKKTVESIFLANNMHEELYPSYFGNEIPYGGSFEGFEIINIKDIEDFEVDTDTTVQIGRAVSSNPKRDDIKNDIVENNYKLRCLPPQGQRMTTGKVRIVNGRTRKAILEEYGVQNIIMGMFKYPSTSGYITHAILSNCEHDPAGNAGMKDVLFAGQKLIDRGELSTDIIEITEWVKTATGNGIFTDNTVNIIAQSIKNNKDKRNYVSMWNPAEVTKWMINEQFEKVQKGPSQLFKDTKVNDNNLYYVVSHSTAMKNVINVAEYIIKNPDKHIRVILHTGTLPTNIQFKALDKKFTELCETHNRYFRDYLNTLKDAFFVSTPKDKSAIKLSDNFTLYGAMPTITGTHTKGEFVIF